MCIRKLSVTHRPVSAFVGRIKMEVACKMSTFPVQPSNRPSHNSLLASTHPLAQIPLPDLLGRQPIRGCTTCMHGVPCKAHRRELRALDRELSGNGPKGLRALMWWR
jgi:hypothetical protein